MIVVFDSTVWFSELGLRSAAGAATKFFLKQKGARLAIPEVVRLEVQRKLYSRLSGHVENIRNDHRQLPVTYTLFATENTELLFLEFLLAFECNDIRGEGRTDAMLRIKGDGLYNSTTGLFSELRNFGEHTTYRRSDGTEGESRNVVGYMGGIVLGHKIVSSEIRYKLNSE